MKLASAPAGRLTSPTCPPVPRAAVGIHSKSALRQQRSARRYTSQPLRYAASRSSIQLVRTRHRARTPCASRLAAREPVPTTARVQRRVAKVPCAARSAQAAGNLARDPPTDPRRSLFLACATSAGPGCAAWHRCAAITHGLPGGRPATPTNPASPTLCGGPGDGQWVAGRVGTPQVNWLCTFQLIHKLQVEGLLLLNSSAHGPALSLSLRFEPPSQPTAVSLLPGLT